jgi:small subunit ribosomal protein S5
MEKTIVKSPKSGTNKSNANRNNTKRKIVTRLSKIKYEEKILQVSRVTKVVKGGKKMTFRAVVIVGDNKKKVGVGVGRADDVNLAMDKAILNGKKNLITVPLTLNFSVPHVVKAKKYPRRSTRSQKPFLFVKYKIIIAL